MLQVLAFTPDWEYYVKSFGWSPGLDLLSIWVTYEDMRMYEDIYEDRRTYEKFSLRTCEDMRIYMDKCRYIKGQKDH